MTIAREENKFCLAKIKCNRIDSDVIDFYTSEFCSASIMSIAEYSFMDG